MSIKNFLEKERKIIIYLFFIFFIAIFLRFLFFPSNVYFGFDQARDAYSSLEILHGHLKLVGPPTSISGLFHGPLFYYIWAPFYGLFKGDPVGIAAFLRVANAFGVLIVFFIGWSLFNKYVGLISAFLFAISFEQTQYSLDFGNPSLSVLTVMLIYLGLSLLVFKRKGYGLVLATVGLGLSIQFEFGLIYLFAPFLLILLLLKEDLRRLDKKYWLYSVAAFLITTATFFISAAKFHLNIFATSVLSFGILATTSGKSFGIPFNTYYILRSLVHDNLFSDDKLITLSLLGLCLSTLVSLFNKKINKKMCFILIWLFAGAIPYLHNNSFTPIYFYKAGAGVGLLIITAYFIYLLWMNKKRFYLSSLLGIGLIFGIVYSNLSLITFLNPKGPIPEIDVQTGMLLSDEKKIVNYIYQSSKGEPFSVNGITMPLYINTTWSYLFSWYGEKSYGRKPIWGGKVAYGYPNDLISSNTRSSLPRLQFLIREPTRGVQQYLIDDFLREENYFTKVVKTEKIGLFTIEEREKI